MANKILSIEIGSQITNVVETDFREKNPKIYKSFSFETPEELFKGEEMSDTEAFRERLQEGLKANKIKTKKVIFVLASSRIASRDVVIPMVKENQILTLLYANSAEYFPVDLQQYLLVYQIIGEVEEEGAKKYKLMVLAIPHDMIETYRRLAADCELILTALDYVGNAAVQILPGRISQSLYAAVKVEDDHTLVTIIKDGKLELQRNFNYGIGDAVSVIRRTGSFGENLNFLQALEILRKNSFCDKKEDERVRDLAEDLEESFRAIIGNVSRVINFYSSNHAGAQMESIVLYGMGADVQDLRYTLREEMSAPIDSETLKGRISRDRSDTNSDISTLAYASCVGAGMEPMDFRLEEEERKKRKEKKKKEGSARGRKLQVRLTAKGFFGICVAVAAVLLLAVVPYYAYLKIDISRMEKERASKQHLSDLYTSYESAKKECEDIAKLYENTDSTSEGIGIFMVEMEKKMPESFSVNTLTSDSASIVIDFDVKTKREAAKVIDEMMAFESISQVEVQSLQETRDELNNATVNCVISCIYKDGTAKDDDAEETTVEEDVEALKNNTADQSASDGLTTE